MPKETKIQRQARFALEQQEAALERKLAMDKHPARMMDFIKRSAVLGVDTDVHLHDETATIEYVNFRYNEDRRKLYLTDEPYEFENIENFLSDIDNENRRKNASSQLAKEVLGRLTKDELAALKENYRYY